MNTITTLVEKKKAQLVVIANDVDPIEVGFRERKAWRGLSRRCSLSDTYWYTRFVAAESLVGSRVRSTGLKGSGSSSWGQTSAIWDLRLKEFRKVIFSCYGTLLE